MVELLDKERLLPRDDSPKLEKSIVKVRYLIIERGRVLYLGMAKEI